MARENSGGKKATKAGGKASQFARRLERGGNAPAPDAEPGALDAALVSDAAGVEARAGGRGRRGLPAGGAAADGKEKRVRITVDASREQHRRLKIFAMDAETDAMSVMRALLDELDSNPALAARIMDRLYKDA